MKTIVINGEAIIIYHQKIVQTPGFDKILVLTLMSGNERRFLIGRYFGGYEEI